MRKLTSNLPFTLAAVLTLAVAAGCTVNISEAPRPRPVVVTAPPPPTPTALRASRVVVSPARTELFAGTTVRFVVRAYAAGGQEVAVQPSWSASHGRMAADGTFTAPVKAGSVVIRVTDALSGLRANAFVKVVGGVRPAVGRAVRLYISPHRTTVARGGRVRFTARAYGRYNRPAGFRAAWSAAGGTISSGGTYTAGSRPGLYLVTVRDTRTGLKAAASVRITGPTVIVRTPVRLAVSPGSASVGVRGTVQFRVAGYDRRGKPVPVRPAWRATGGTVSNTGLFTAGSRTGTYIVSASVGRLRSSARVTVTRPVIVRRVARVSVSPSRTLVKSGKTAQFAARGYDRSGRLIAFRPTWSATGGSISSTGLFKGTRPGTYTVTARAPSGARGTATVTVGHVIRPRPPKPPKPKPPVIHKPPRPKPPKPKPPVVHRPRPRPRPPVVVVPARLAVSRWKVKGSIAKPKLECSVATYGSKVRTVRIYGISPKGKVTLLQSRMAKDKQTVTFNAGFHRLKTKWIEVRLYDAAGKIVAREKRLAK